MTLTLSGISVSRGVVIGKAAILRRDELNVTEYTIPRPLLHEEITRFRAALRKAKRQLKAIRNRIPGDTPGEVAFFIDAHLLMLEDSVILEGPISIIQTRRCNAEWALKQQRDALVRVFEELDDAYLRARKDDIDHVVNRIQRNLQGHYDGRDEVHDYKLRGAILVADDLSPAETLLMQQQGVAAFVTEFGGANSHTAILARSLGIPAIAGVHHARRFLREDELVVINARQGVVIAAPGASELEYFRASQREEKRYLAGLSKLSKRPAVTRDGHAITLMANVEIEEDFAVSRRVGASGIGLFRTEMLFINRDDLPGEEEQYEAYTRAVEEMNGAPVTIRTLDLGADKCLGEHGRESTEGMNPALGLRAIRWSLKDPALFSPQLRAILRASARGPVRMMIPMLSNESELLQVLRLIDEEKAGLERSGIAFDPAIMIGAMIEVPAAALAAGIFTRRLDFLSIGTNDLIQYALAVDRRDEEVNYLYDPLHPAILRLIHMTIAAGRRAGIPVGMCGEMAGEPLYTRLLLGMGLREFSMYPATLLEVKQVIAGSDLSTLVPEVRRILRMESAERIGAALEAVNRLQ
jgi:phosphoenolpyruvate-protein phosphotransferase (PTS system enzyme I)